MRNYYRFGILKDTSRTFLKTRFVVGMHMNANRYNIEHDTFQCSIFFNFGSNHDKRNGNQFTGKKCAGKRSISFFKLFQPSKMTC